MKELEIVCETVNRLLRLERETSQDLFVAETLHGMLTALGFAIRFEVAGTLLDWHPLGMSAESLRKALEIWEVECIDRDHSEPIPPPAYMFAMITEGLADD